MSNDYEDCAICPDLQDEIERLRARNKRLEEACDEALNCLIGCCISAGGCDDAETILTTQAALRAALED